MPEPQDRDMQFWDRVRGRLAVMGFDPHQPPADGLVADGSMRLTTVAARLRNMKDGKRKRITTISDVEVEEFLRLLGWDVVDGLICRRNREAVAS